MGSGIASGGGGACADSSCAGFLTCQNFETATTGYDNSETWTNASGGDATANPASTSSPLRGIQSVLLTANTATASIEHTLSSASGTIYGVFRFSIASFASTGDSELVKLYDVSYNPLLYLYLKAEDWGGDKRKINFVSGGMNVQSTNTISAANTTYWVWWYYKAGTGANGEAGISITTTATAPGSWEGSGTTGTATAAAAIFRLRITIAGLVGKFDQVLVKSTAIGTVCNP